MSDDLTAVQILLTVPFFVVAVVLIKAMINGDRRDR